MNVFIFDFDGTITTKDTIDLILEIPENNQIWQIEEEWKRGKITSYQCMKAQAKFLKGITTERIYQCLKQHSRMDPNFPALIQFLNSLNFHTVILSEGYDLSIGYHRVHKYIKRIHCSKVVIENGRITGELDISNEKLWDYNEKCIGCCICKVDFLNQLKNEYDVTKSFAVGDGRSDECLFQYVDVSFSLNPNYKAVYQVKDLSDVLKTLKKSHILT